VQVCFTLLLNGTESADLTGERTAAARAAISAGGPLSGRVLADTFVGDGGDVLGEDVGG
jgi:hypothetical protein